MHPTRRRFLRFGAASLLAAPFCDQLIRPARAAPAPAPTKRLLVFFSPNGTIHNQWRPTSSDLDLAPGSILEPLADYRDDLLVLDGITFHDADNHEGGMAAMLTAGTGTSLDQHVADALASDHRFRSLELGVQTSAWGGNVQTRMSYRDGAYVTPDDDPQSVWRRLFGDLGDESLLQRRQSVIDLASAELDDLHARLGAAERARLDRHLESLREVERGLQGDGRCEDTPSPDDITASDVYNNDAFPDIAAAQIDLAVQALACGVTPVASVQLSHTVSPAVFTWLGVSDSHHTLSHIDDGNTSGVADFVTCERWISAQVASAISQLGAMEDPDGGSLLDSTVVLWVKEMGDGRAHVCTDVPWLIAGGGFDTGRYLSLGGVSHGDVLDSVRAALGLTGAHYGAGALEVLR